MVEVSKRLIRVPSRRELQRADLRGKKVLARFDFNVPMENGKISDSRRIELAIPTIKMILAKDPAEINLICHLGRPEKLADPQFSTLPIAKFLARRLGAKFAPEPETTNFKSPALKKFYKITPKINLFENLRFDLGEDDNQLSFAKEIAGLGDVFVLDAFANIHRKHASMFALQKLLPTYAGLIMTREINTLFRLLHSPKRPFVAIIGGAKIKDKLPVIETLSKIADSVLVGGRTANEWILNHHPVSKNIFLPVDGISKFGTIVEINEQSLKKGIHDIGPQTIMLYKSVIASARTIFWNGNLGVTEDKKFTHGTYEIARFMARHRAEKIVSGGNTAEVIDKLELSSSFDFISTGGGATSDFVTGKKLPVLEELLK